MACSAVRGHMPNTDTHKYVFLANDGDVGIVDEIVPLDVSEVTMQFI